MYLKAGNSKRRQWKGVDNAWEVYGTGLMIPDGREDGGNVFEGGEQRAAIEERC